MEKLINSIKGKLNKEKGLKLIVVLGLIAIALILFSEFIPQKNEEKVNTKSSTEANKFQQEMESKLTNTLSTINGVGRVNVMLTVSCTEEYVYAEEVKDSKSNDTNKNTIQNENKYVLIDSNGEKEALVKKVLNPQINGVVIVCEGGGSVKVCESTYRTVSTVLGIPTNKIYVTKIK